MRYAITLAILLCAQPVFAQDADAEAEAAYTHLIEEGVAEFARGNWEESYLLFSDAHKMQPNARTYRGMGMSAYEARQYVRAYINLTASLSDERRALSDAQKQEVQGLIAKTERFVAHMELALSPEGAEVRIDGREPVLDENGMLLLDRGTHELVAKAPGHETSIRRLVVRAGEKGRFEVKLTPEGGGAVAQQPQAAPAVDAGASLDGVGEEPERDYMLVYVAGGTAVAFAGTALILYLMASGEVDSILEDCDGNCSPDEVDDKIADGSIEGLQTTSGIFWGLSGVAAVTAGVLYYLEAGRTETAATEPGVDVAVGPTSLQLRGRF